MTQLELFAYRLFQHGLLTTDAQPLVPFERVIGIQAQNQRAAILNAALQSTATAATFTELLTTKQLVRSWAQRWTVHLLTPADWELVINARQNERLPKAYFLGLPTEVAAAADYLALLLQDQPSLSRVAYVDQMTAKFSWFKDRPKNLDYAIFQLLTSRGQLVMSASNSARQPDLLRPAAFQRQSQLSATTTLLKRFLTTFGPATIADFAKWSGIKRTNVRPAWQQLAPTLVPVVVNDQTLWQTQPISTTQLQTITDSVQSQTLIAADFSSVMTGYVDKSWFANRAAIKQLWSTNGLLRAPIIANGLVVGIWHYKLTATKIQFSVTAWGPFDTPQLTQHFERLAQFLQRDYQGFTVTP